MLSQMSKLTQRVAELPGTRTELTTFPSGAVMLDVWREDRLFVMAYTPTWKGFGVDEVLDGEGLLEEYDFFSHDFTPAAERLWQIVQQAQHGLKPAESLDPSQTGIAKQGSVTS